MGFAWLGWRCFSSFSWWYEKEENGYDKRSTTINQHNGSVDPISPIFASTPHADPCGCSLKDPWIHIPHLSHLCRWWILMLSFHGSWLKHIETPWFSWLLKAKMELKVVSFDLIWYHHVFFFVDMIAIFAGKGRIDTGLFESWVPPKPQRIKTSFSKILYTWP